MAGLIVGAIAKFATKLATFDPQFLIFGLKLHVSGPSATTRILDPRSLIEE